KRERLCKSGIAACRRYGWGIWGKHGGRPPDRENRQWTGGLKKKWALFTARREPGLAQAWMAKDERSWKRPASGAGQHKLYTTTWRRRAVHYDLERCRL